MSSNVSKQARRDAQEYARAQMFYGEGAGIRRKLITNSVASKVERISGYHEAFTKELERQDMAEHAAAARKERRRRDASDSLQKNAKSLATGNYANVNIVLLTVVGIGYVAHQTGYDVKVYQAVQKKVRDIRSKRETRKMKRRMTVVS